MPPGAVEARRGGVARCGRMRRGGVAQVTACAGMQGWGGVGQGSCAPERKVTPGMAGGRQRSRVCTVILAMVAGSDLSGHLVGVRAVGLVSESKPARTLDNQGWLSRGCFQLPSRPWGTAPSLGQPAMAWVPPGALALSSRQGLRTRRRARSSRA